MQRARFDMEVRAHNITPPPDPPHSPKTPWPCPLAVLLVPRHRARPPRPALARTSAKHKRHINLHVTTSHSGGCQQHAKTRINCRAVFRTIIHPAMPCTENAAVPPKRRAYLRPPVLHLRPLIHDLVYTCAPHAPFRRPEGGTQAGWTTGASSTYIQLFLSGVWTDGAEQHQLLVLCALLCVRCFTPRSTMKRAPHWASRTPNLRNFYFLDSKRE